MAEEINPKGFPPSPFAFTILPESGGIGASVPKATDVVEWLL